MANKRAQGIQIGAFNPKGAVAGSLPNVPRPDGSTDDAVSGIAAGLARRFSAIADEQAVIEGEKAGQAAGNDKGFRPDGVTTLRGQAYDKAGIKTYLDNLDAALRQDLQGVFEKNSNNPEGLKTALDGVKSTYEKEHVFPEIAGRFNAHFEILRMPYQKKAFDNFESDKKDREGASLIRTVNEVDTTTKRAQASIDPNDPGAGVLIASGVAQKEGLYRRAAKDGIITEKAAETAIIKDRREATVDFEFAKANKLQTPEEIAAFRADARKRFGEGKIASLDGAGFDVLDAQLQRLETAARTQGETVSGALTRQVDDYVKRAAAGDKPRAEEWNQILTAAKLAPNGDAVVAQASAKLALAEAVRNRPIAEGRAFVDAERAKLRAGGGAAPGQVELLNYADELIAEQQKALRNDQIGLAARKGIVPQATVIDLPAYGAQPGPETVAALTGQFRARAAQSHAVGQTFGVEPQFLRPHEKEQLLDLVRQGGDKALGVAQAIVAGAGTDAPAVFRELGQEAPLLAQAGAILVSGGSRSAARDALEPARVKAESGAEMVKVPDLIYGRARQSEFGDAYADIPDEAARVSDTARAIARTRIAREGFDPKAEPKRAEKIAARAYQEAAGATFDASGKQFGGIAEYTVKEGSWFFGAGASSARVIVPASVRADRFRDVVRAITDADLAALPVPPVDAAGKPYKARDLHVARPLAVPGGYRFALGDIGSNNPKFLRGADGNVFVLPFDQLVPELRKRVPAAFGTQ